MRLALAALASFIVVIAACGGTTPGGGDCREGTPIACTCADGRPGAGVCGVEGCDCPPRYALAAEPASVDFGETARGSARDTVVLIHNPSPREVRLRSADLLGGHPGAFGLPDGFPAAIPADGIVPLAVRFTPAIPGSAVARLRVEADDADVAAVEVILTGRVPGPLLSCWPAAVEFPAVWAGEAAAASVVCANVGLAGAGDEARLALTGLEVAGTGFSAAWGPGTAPASGLAVGEWVEVALAFAPAVAGEHRGTLTVTGDGVGVAVPLVGFARETPACDVDYPEQLRFGIFDGAVTYEFFLRNRHAEAPCTVRNLRLCEGTDPAYTLAGGPYERVVIPGGGELRFALRFAPTDDSCAEPEEQGCLEFDLSPSPDGHRSIPLACYSREPSVLIAPDDLDFGTVEPGCATRDREFQLINVGEVPVVFRDLEFPAGASDAFFARSFPPPGTTVAPGLAKTFTIAYRPEDDGQDLGAVFVWIDGLQEPLMATLRGSAAPLSRQRDTFAQCVLPQVDVLVVIDNGTTMAAEAARIVAELGGLPAEAWGNVHARFAVTTTGLVAGGPGCPGGANGGEDGRFFPVDGSRPRILDEGTPDLLALWEANLAVGACHTAAPLTLEAAVRALTPPLSTSADDPRHPQPNDGNLGFLRPDAHLSVIAVSNRADASPGTVDAYYQALVGLKGGRHDRVSFSAVTGDRASGCSSAEGRSAAAGDRLIDLVERTGGGLFTSFCGADWFEPWLRTEPQASGCRSCFSLGNLPMDENGDGLISDENGELRVFLDGQEVPSTRDGERIWSYARDAISVCFSPLHVPGEGAAVEIEYAVSCLGW